jgi:DNA-binding response OmpR family regulator
MLLGPKGARVMRPAIDCAIGSTLARPRVLLAEDSELNLALLRRRLGRRGFLIYEAMSGEAAIETAERLRPDLMLLDLRLPELDGLEVLRKVRRSFTRMRLPVIVVTADHDPQMAMQCIEAGANEYITKPIAWTLLLERIDLQLELHFAYVEAVGTADGGDESDTRAN